MSATDFSRKEIETVIEMFLEGRPIKSISNFIGKGGAGVCSEADVEDIIRRRMKGWL